MIVPLGRIAPHLLTGPNKPFSAGGQTMGSTLRDGSSAHHKGLLRGQPSAEVGLHACSMCHTCRLQPCHRGVWTGTLGGVPPVMADGVGASRGGWPCPPTLRRSHSGGREYDTYTQRQERQKEEASGAPPFHIPLPLRPSCAPVPSLIPKDISSLPELASFCLSSCFFPSFTRKEEKRQEWLAYFTPLYHFTLNKV